MYPIQTARFGTSLSMNPRYMNRSPARTGAVDIQLNIAARNQPEAGRGDDYVGVHVASRPQTDSALGEAIDAVVTIEAFPAVMASNRSPSGTMHMRWSQGL